MLWTPPSINPKPAPLLENTRLGKAGMELQLSQPVPCNFCWAQTLAQENSTQFACLKAGPTIGQSEMASSGGRFWVGSSSEMMELSMCHMASSEPTSLSCDRQGGSCGGRCFPIPSIDIRVCCHSKLQLLCMEGKGSFFFPLAERCLQ